MRNAKTNVLRCQSGLFDKTGLAGLAMAEAIVTPSEEEALIASIEGVDCRRSAFTDGSESA
jgi:hypothetical protein